MGHLADMKWHHAFILPMLSVASRNQLDKCQTKTSLKTSQSNKGSHSAALKLLILLMARGGIEPSTHGFSVIEGSFYLLYLVAVWLR
jgi:hypothetical protein